MLTFLLDIQDSAVLGKSDPIGFDSGRPLSIHLLGRLTLRRKSSLQTSDIRRMPRRDRSLSLNHDRSHFYFRPMRDFGTASARDYRSKHTAFWKTPSAHFASHSAVAFCTL